MSERPFQIDSNKPCTDREGVYDAWVYTVEPHALPSQPMAVDLGRIFSNREDPAQIVNWTYHRLTEQRTFDNQPTPPKSKVAGIAITRLCISTSHTPEPGEYPYSSRHREMVMQILVGEEQAEPFDLVRPRQTDFDAAGIGLVTRSVGEINMRFSGIMLPRHTAPNEDFAVAGAVNLAVPTKRPIIGVIRGDEYVVSPSQLEFTGDDRE